MDLLSAVTKIGHGRVLDDSVFECLRADETLACTCPQHSNGGASNLPVLAVAHLPSSAPHMARYIPKDPARRKPRYSSPLTKKRGLLRTVLTTRLRTCTITSSRPFD